jgi:hypothetical protein
MDSKKAKGRWFKKRRKAKRLKKGERQKAFKRGNEPAIKSVWKQTNEREGALPPPRRIWEII